MAPKRRIPNRRQTVSLREARFRLASLASILRAGGIAYDGGRAPSERRHIVMSTPKVTLVQRVRDLIAGTMKHSPTGPLSLGGRSFTAQSLIQFLQDMENAIPQVDTAPSSGPTAAGLSPRTETRLPRKVHGRSEAEGRDQRKRHGGGRHDPRRAGSRESDLVQGPSALTGRGAFFFRRQPALLMP